MATSAQHMNAIESETGPAFRKAEKPPITANPAFAWIVALWFAALLGIGSLILPVALLERASLASGLPSLLPFAAPPLGFTARLLLAICGTVGGGALGFILARRLGAARAAASHRAIPAIAADRAPLDAAADLDAEGIDAHDDLPQPKARRRALAMEEEEGHSDFLNLVPLPGAADLHADTAEGAAMEASEEAHGASGSEGEEARADAEEPFVLEADAALPEDDDREQARQEFLPSPTEPAPRPSLGISFDEPVQAAATARDPLPFSPPSMARIEPHAEEDAGSEHKNPSAPNPDDAAAATEFGPESEESVSDKLYFEAEEPNEAACFDDSPSPELGDEDADEALMEEQNEGLVQLVQRLGSTLEKHREWAARQAAQPPAEAETSVAQGHVSARLDTQETHKARPMPFDPAAAEEAEQAMAAYFAKADAGAAAPFAKEHAEPEPGESFVAAPEAQENEGSRPRYGSFAGTLAAAGPQAAPEDGEVDDSEDEIAEIAASFTLPLKQEQPAPIPRPAFDQPPAATTPPAEPEASAEPDDSRAAPRNPFRRDSEEYVRIEEPEDQEGITEPAVLFPNQTKARFAQPASRAFDPPVSDGTSSRGAPARPAPSNDDNERALREALMNLQRMGK